MSLPAAMMFFGVGAWLGVTIGFVISVLAFAPHAEEEGEAGV